MVHTTCLQTASVFFYSTLTAVANYYGDLLWRSTALRVQVQISKQHRFAISCLRACKTAVIIKPANLDIKQKSR